MPYTEHTYFDGETEVMVHQDETGAFTRAYIYAKDAQGLREWIKDLATEPGLNPSFLNVVNPVPERFVRKLRAAGFCKGKD